MSSITTGQNNVINFSYNAGGQRMVKIGNSRSVLYQIIDGVAVGESINNGQTVIYYLFDEKGNVYGLNVNGSEYFLRKNLQGDVVGIWDSETGEQVVTYTYDPWGKLLSVTDTTNSGLGTLNPFRYRSYYYDIETGLYYLQSRYYDPEIGRFINADGLLAGADEVNLNQFAYCGNNPTCCVDRTGMRQVYGLTTSETTNSYVAKQTTQQVKESKIKDGVSFDDFRNPDGSYSLHDNYRTSPGQKFHERLFEFKYHKPEFSLSDFKFGLGGASATIITGTWVTEHIDYSLANVGEAKVSARFDKGKIDLCAMASIYSPNILIKLDDIDIELSAHVGSIGFSAYKDNGAAGAGFGCGWWGISLNVKWDKND